MNTIDLDESDTEGESINGSPTPNAAPMTSDHPVHDQDATLLDRVTRETVPFFDMPHRSVSNVTIVPSMEMSWHDLTVSPKVKESKKDAESAEPVKLLDSVFGVAHSGQVLAIIGSSGCGKTTMLNTLSFTNTKATTIHGTIKVNNLAVESDYMRKISAYVQQDDLFIGSLTVTEHLTFIARLKMGKKHNVMDQKKRVRTIIQELGLQTVANNIIGTRTRKGLSGGEKKRLAFAQEILTSPPILFCDEPTSGLDAFLAFQVIKVLKDLAERKGMTIIITIHQPSSQVFEQFDRICVLAEGRVAFCGNHAEAQETWKLFKKQIPQNFNPADHMIRTLSVSDDGTEIKPETIKKMCDHFIVSKIGRHALNMACDGEEKDMPVEIAHRRRTTSKFSEKYQSTYFQQLGMLCWRQLCTTLREPTLLKVQIMHSVVIALLTGLVYVGTPLLQSTVLTINGALFQCVSNMSFMFQFSAVHHFHGEIPVFMREHRNSLYRTSPYFLAKNIVEIPMFVLLSFVFCSILYWMSPLVGQLDAFLIYCLIAALVQQSAISVGYFFSCAVPQLPIAMAIMPLFVVPMMTFAGFFINQETLPVYFYPLKYLSWFNYGLEAMTVNEWTRVDEIPGCYANSTKCLYPHGSDVLKALSFDPSNLWRDIFLMGALILTIRALAFVALFIRARRNG